ncbi:sodium:proton antiporter [Segatella asaccharophila]
MAELPDLIKDLALILIIAGVVTLLFKKLKQPLVLGYLVAGFLVSPHMPYTISIMDKSSIQTWADIGVIFLLFSLGLDFSFKKIIKMGIAPVIATCTIIFCMMTLGVLVGHAFGWRKMDCIFLGGMLAIASTTIIYKAFNDLDLIQQNFAGLVMSVLILEDILAIVMMVMLSTIARGNNPDGGQLIESILRIAFFLILWFIVGLSVIPLFLRYTRQLMNDETLVIVSLGLCFLMAVISSKVGFSPAFGAFVMGSILAETIEAEKITRLVAPVKNLFGAVFFVSVGMLVDPKIIAGYAIPILILVITVIGGEAIFGTAGFLLSGQPLKTAMKCSFSMTQIGEFAFIIASLGLSLHVISNFLYPVVVAVSIITTFLTPYMIRFSSPCYQYLEHHLPKRWIRRLNHITLSIHSTSKAERNNWGRLLRALLKITIICSILCVAGIFLMFTFILPIFRHIFGFQTGNIVGGVLTVLLISPALRAMVTKKNHSEEVKALWTEKRINRLPILFTVLVRYIIASGFVFYICNYLTRFNNALLITFALTIITLMIASKKLKKGSIRLERLFVQNLHSREIRAQVQGKRRPLYEGHLLDRDIHISLFDISEDSVWGGKSLRELQLRKRFGIQVSSILRGHQRINIPNGHNSIYPGDRLEVIGNDKQLTQLNQALKNERVPEDPDIENREMKLRQFVVTDQCPLIGKNLKESGIRDHFNCMVVGLDEGQENLEIINPERKFLKGDILWVVGEEASLNKLIGDN